MRHGFGLQTAEKVAQVAPKYPAAQAHLTLVALVPLQVAPFRHGLATVHKSRAVPQVLPLNNATPL